MSENATAKPHVIIVGAGIAGMSCALQLIKNQNTQVTLLAKDTLGQGNTVMAQSGVAAAWHPDDSTALHSADTIKSGAGIATESASKYVAEHAVEAIKTLEAWGVTWDRPGSDAEAAETSATSLASLETRQTGGHSFPRSAHSGGDRTGRVIAFALRDLVSAAAKAGEIQVMEKTLIRDLVVENGRVIGVHILDGEAIHADAVVLATGGAGTLYQVTTNLRGAVGSSVAMAFRAGAVIRDAEFFQFHPTSLNAPGYPLIGEAVRGKGAHIIDDEGRRFLFDYDERGELASRDIVARSIYQHTHATGQNAYLDTSPIGDAEAMSKLFPGMSRQLAAKRLTWDEPIPITPSAHYWMGGIASLPDGRTTLPGLFAIGEAGCNGMHGANRLATNSLLEGCVTGLACANLLSEDAHPAPYDAADLDVTKVTDLATGSNFDANADLPQLQQLQELMWKHAGVVRSAAGLENAAIQLKAWRDSLPPEGHAHDRSTQEITDAVTAASLLVKAALSRQETRGAHTRSDFPNIAADAKSKGQIRA